MEMEHENQVGNRKENEHTNKVWKRKEKDHKVGNRRKSKNRNNYH